MKIILKEVFLPIGITAVLLAFVAFGVTLMIQDDNFKRAACPAGVFRDSKGDLWTAKGLTIYERVLINNVKTGSICYLYPSTHPESKGEIRRAGLSGAEGRYWRPATQDEIAVWSQYAVNDPQI